MKISYHKILIFFQFFWRSKQKQLKKRPNKNANHTKFIERKKGFPQPRADIATGVRDFFPNNENCLL